MFWGARQTLASLTDLALSCLAGLAIHQMLPLLSTNVNREPLSSMMTQELYDRFESELQRQEEVKSDVSIQLAAVHDGVVKDVWVLLGPKLKSGSTRGFIRWRWQSLTIALRAATDQMSSRDQVAHMMMEGVQFKVDVECMFCNILLFVRNGRPYCS